MINISEINNEILALIKDWEPRLTSLTNEKITLHRNSQNRIVKQILGHLIDSVGFPKIRSNKNYNFGDRFLSLKSL